MEALLGFILTVFGSMLGVSIGLGICEIIRILNKWRF